MMAGYIDLVANLYTPDIVAEGFDFVDEGFKAQVRMDPEIWNGLPIEKYLEKKNKAGIERTFLAAARMGDLLVRGSVHIPYERVHKVCQQFPDRFSGLAGIDPTLGMKQL